jgi:hypothetical protein
MKRQAGILALVLAVGAVACGDDDEPAETSGAEPKKSTAKKITASGVGGVKLDKTYAQLRQQGLVKKIVPGCELAGPDARSAALEAPLKGGVDFTPTSPRKVTYITISGGAKARGVGVGASISEIKAAFPQAKVGGESVAGYTLVDIPKNSGGPLTFAVKPDTKKTIAIGIPGMAFCE